MVIFIYTGLDTVAVNPTGFLVQFSSPYMTPRTDLSPIERELHVLHRKWVKMQCTFNLNFSHNIWIFFKPIHHTNFICYK